MEQVALVAAPVAALILLPHLTTIIKLYIEELKKERNKKIVAFRHRIKTRNNLS